MKKCYKRCYNLAARTISPGVGPLSPPQEGLPKMARQIVDAIKRAFDRSYQEPAVHFHAADGNPEVCYDLDCERPRLSA